jgi:hypothetical protein
MQRWLIGVVAGAVFGALATLLAAGAAGAGHGTYVPAAILFPYTMSISALMGTIALPLIALAFLQYPIYGWLMGRASKVGQTSFALLCVHVASIFAALFVMSSRGSFW